MKLISLLPSTYLKSRLIKLYSQAQTEGTHKMYDSADISLAKACKNNKKIFINTTIIMAASIFFSTNAIARNLTCPAGYVVADLSESDYQQLTKGTSDSINIQGSSSAIASLGLQLNINMTTNGTTHYLDSFGSTTGFTMVQELGDNTLNNDITYRFNKPVNKLSFTLYDIDMVATKWRDKVTITGKNVNTTVPFTFSNSGNNFTINGNTVESNYSLLGLRECKTYFDSKCATTVTFNDPITEFTLDYRNTILTGVLGQNIELRFNKFCVEEPTLKIEKDDGVTEVTKDSVTNYVIKVKNQGNSSITNATLSDPSVSGLIKQSGIQCDTSTSNNACITAPTITQLENGFILPTLAKGQTYAITVPTQVTANVGSSITNTATVQYNAKTISAEDTNTVKAAFAPPSPPKAKKCPANHQMYYIGDNAPSAVTTSNKQSYDWSNGITEKTYTFIGSNGNQTKMKLAFPLLIDADNQQPNPYGYQEVPFYYTNFDITTGAINLAHKSRGKKTNHKLQVTINKPVSQFGFVIQDLDSTGGSNGGTSGAVQYIEQVDVSESAGKLLNHDSYYHEINATQDIVTARKLRNCKRHGEGSGCPIDATWGYKSTNQPFSLKHNNTETRNGNIQHLIGYSDFYFCLAPPKIIINKVLNGNRIASEQFKINITDNNAFSEGFTTEGADNSITLGKNTSGTLELKPNQTYTITESVVDGGSNADYSTTYTCSNTAKDSSAQIPQNGTGKSFSISSLSYGDEIVCTITNTPVAVAGPAPTIKLRKSLPNGSFKNTDRFNFKIFKQTSTSSSDGELITSGPTKSAGLSQGIHDVELRDSQGQALQSPPSLTDFNSATYIIKEESFSGTNTKLSKYNTSYSCIDEASSNGTNGTHPIIASGTGTKFKLSNLSTGQKIICTFENVAKVYTFSGIVFNDNGGFEVEPNGYKKEDAQAIRNNQFYFNGNYDPTVNETGIYVDGLSAELTNCSGNKITNQRVYIAKEDKTMTSISDANDIIKDDNIKKGQYKIIVPVDNITTSSVCINEIEPQSWQQTYGADVYPIDTTTNQHQISILPGTTKYTNKNFGEVRQNNSALILIKRQYLNNCKISSLTAIAETSDPSTGYSTEDYDADNITKNQVIASNECIAYKITAKNRSQNSTLNDVTITDKLLNKSEGKKIRFYDMPQKAHTSGVKFDSVPNSNETGSIISTPFQLVPNHSESIYFNTKYYEENTANTSP